MLRYRLTHPQIVSALASAGHGSQVLLADGHYPVSTASRDSAMRVFLNLTPDHPTVPEVLDVLLDAVVVERAAVMRPPADVPEPDVFQDFARLLPDVPVERFDRHTFYDAARSPDVALVVATGERRTYANLLLTLGVLAV